MLKLFWMVRRVIRFGALGLVLIWSVNYSNILEHVDNAYSNTMDQGWAWVEEGKTRVSKMLSLPVANAQTSNIQIIDGDTLEMDGQRYRLHGIDAPESRQLCLNKKGQKWQCGKEATSALRSRIGSRKTECVVRDTDRYGRHIAVCRANGEDLNRWMVLNGWAVAYTQYSTDYVREEWRAKSDTLGIWGGQFEMPWTWRRNQ